MFADCLGTSSPASQVLKDLGPDADIAGSPHSYATVSIKNSMKTLFKALVSAFTTRNNVPYRIWKIEPGEFLGSHFPVSKLVNKRFILATRIQEHSGVP
ncbi:hypothetical protein EDB19DRAFT_1703700 [Suillus lakei]|nr:hypothetical protein EDB19DRAFT_1703700 [Suillus lakei]